MKNLYDLIKLNLIIIILALIAALTMQANANVKNDRYKNAIVRELTERLRVELADRSVEVKLNDVREREISSARVDFDGKALAVVKIDKTELPFQFTAKVNLNNQNIEDVTYQFVEADSEFPAAAEDNLMKHLMSEISRDYATTNIVIAIDGFDAAQITSAQTRYEGTGEVRIGDLEWRKIKFSVVLDSQRQTATKVLYDVQK